jgi:hypothetical protein
VIRNFWTLAHSGRNSEYDGVGHTLEIAPIGPGTKNRLTGVGGCCSVTIHILSL